MTEKTEIFSDKQIFENETFDYVINEEGGSFEGDINFSNCTFNFPVSIKNINIKGRLMFSGCTFKHYTLFSKIECDVFHIYYGSYNNTLNFRSCKVNSFSISDVKGDKCFINGSYNRISIYNNIISEIKFKDFNTSRFYLEPTLELRKNRIQKLDIISTNIFSSIIFKGGNYDWISLTGEFNDSILFNEDISITDLFFEASTFNNRIDFKNGSYENIYIQRNNFKGMLWISDFDIIKQDVNELKIKSLTLHSNNFEKDVNVDLSKSISLDISDNSFTKSLNFKSSKLNYNENNRITLSGINNGNIILDGIYSSLDISCINFGTISIKNSRLIFLIIQDFQNNGKLSFFNISDSVYLVIEDSKLGDTEFLNTDLNQFKEVVIANSNISNIILQKYFFNVRSFNKDKNIGFGIENKKENYSNLKNVYNQLKKSALNKGDVDSASRYQSLEYNNLYKDKRIGADKILLLFNHLSNKNGYSWRRGIIFTFIVSMIFFCGYVYLNEKDNYFFSVKYINQTTINEFKEYDFWSKYIKFFTSFPKLSLDELKKDTWVINLWIWLARIFISYGIYQTIAAFRKYGKG